MFHLSGSQSAPTVFEGPAFVEGSQGEKLLSAQQAEGIIGLLQTILKQIPADLLGEHWPACLATLDSYLAHPASTVRQTSSTIFESVASRVTSEVRGWL